MVGTSVIVIDGDEYFLSKGTFYIKVRREGKDVYVVIDPPTGAEVPSLPEGVRELEVAGMTYYQFDRIFYRKLGGVYVVVDPPAPA